MQEIGLPKEAKILERCAALHDSCGARGDAETQRSVRDILKKLGVSILETEYSGDRSPCCGYGGLASYTNRELAHELQKALADYNDRGKDPDPIAKEMAHLKTGFRLKMSRTDNTVADLVTDGCNMGIKSINRYMNKYKAADERSKNLAKRISDIEENLAFDIRKFL